MRFKYLFSVLAAGLAGSLMLRADGGSDFLTATAEDTVFALDTMGSPRVLTAMDAIALTYRAGESVSALPPDSASASTLVENAAGVGAFGWSPTAGGLWTLENSVSGVATFYVRYSLFPSGGTGTATTPARLVDDAELDDLVAIGRAAAGFTFVLYGTATIDALALPAGYSLTALGDGIYRLDTMTGDELYGSVPEPAFALDTERPGPNRTAVKDDTLSVAYSGDSWVGATSAASTLTFTSPSGAAIMHSCMGTGTIPFQPAEDGVWTITLTAGESSLSALLRIKRLGMSICIR